jgi:hypothetical protein
MHSLVNVLQPVPKLLFLLISLLTSARILVAQEAPCQTRLLPIFVTDKDGNPLRTLSVPDFKLEAHGTPLSIVSWTPDGRRHRVVILLDVSASMKGLSGPWFWHSVMAIAQHVAAIESDNTQFALLLFSDQVVETVDFSKGNAAVRRRMEEIAKDPAFAKRGDKGGTIIFDALKEGFHQFDSPTSADSLLVITDGGDEGSKTKPDEILKLVSGPMVRLFSILVIDPVFAGQTQSVPGLNSAALADLVQKSGGSVLGPVDLKKAGLTNSSNSPESRKVFSDTLVQFYRGILQNDLMTIQVSADLTKARPLRLSLSDSTQHQWKHTHIFYPHEIGLCPVSGPPEKVLGN